MRKLAILIIMLVSALGSAQTFETIGFDFSCNTPAEVRILFPNGEYGDNEGLDIYTHVEYYGTDVLLTAEGSDADGNTLTYEWYRGDDALTVIGTGATLTVSHTAVIPRRTTDETYIVKANDGTHDSYGYGKIQWVNDPSIFLPSATIEYHSVDGHLTAEASWWYAQETVYTYFYPTGTAASRARNSNESDGSIEYVIPHEGITAWTLRISHGEDVEYFDLILQ